MSKEDNQKSGEKRGNIAQLLDFAGNRKNTNLYWLCSFGSFYACELCSLSLYLVGGARLTCSSAKLE